MLALLRTAAPLPLPDWGPVETARGCRLDALGSGPPCPCERWPGRLRLALGQPLDPDRASAAELEALPGLGPARAAAIVAERERGGPYAQIGAIERRVRGIGPATLGQVAPQLRVDPCVRRAGSGPDEYDAPGQPGG